MVIDSSCGFEEGDVVKVPILVNADPFVRYNPTIAEEVTTAS